jgi:formylglycine-generating enzyme required for sulfatase activity
VDFQAPTEEPWQRLISQLEESQHEESFPQGKKRIGRKLKLKIFLSYSSGDKPAVRALYQKLQADGFAPWLDEEDLLPGQKWEQEIPKAVRACDAIIVCLSRGSITKEGFVQKEIKLALDVAEEKPEDTIFLIPLKLDECDIPDRLKGWQAGSLHRARGYENLLRALETRADGMGIAKMQIALPQTVSNSIGMEFILIPAGEFLMGWAGGYEEERLVHQVRITKPFYLGKYQVTQAQWQAVMSNNPSHFKGDLNRPVEGVSWNDTQDFLKRLSEKDGKPYQLPTEAEWEYAARAGSTGEYCFGDGPRLLREYAWYNENAGGMTHPVGQLNSNAWRLHDMHGNVWEWVQDWYTAAYYGQSQAENPQGPKDGADRVVRGGSWSRGARYLRVSYRSGYKPGARLDDVGVRCAW